MQNSQISQSTLTVFLTARLVLLQGDVQSNRASKQGSGNVEQTAKQWLSGGQKWLKSAGKKLATAAKESASEIQKRLETADVKMQKGSMTWKFSVKPESVFIMKVALFTVDCCRKGRIKSIKRLTQF